MRNILCVENDYITSYLLQKQIERIGFYFAGAVESGEEAIKRSQTIKPDLVLMDIKLSGFIDGIEAADYIVNKLDIPVIFITGYADLQTRKRAELVHPVNYLVKPVEMTQLQKVIEYTLTRVA